MARPAASDREVVFDASQLDDLNAVAQQLFCSGAQPWEQGYPRVLVRPPVRWGRLLLNCAVPLAACAALFVLLRGVWPAWAALLTALGALMAYVLVRLKSLIIALVELYQHFAPDHVRCKCRFEPSCSMYMIGAVRKYGAWRGMRKGIDRRRRCNINNGGYDEP